MVRSHVVTEVTAATVLEATTKEVEAIETTTTDQVCRPFYVQLGTASLFTVCFNQ